MKFSDVDVATDGAVRMNLWQGVTGEEKKQLAEIFAKQVRGRILAFKEGDEALAFEPYREGGECANGATEGEGEGGDGDPYAQADEAVAVAASDHEPEHDAADGDGTVHSVGQGSGRGIV